MISRRALILCAAGLVVAVGTFNVLFPRPLFVPFEPVEWTPTGWQKGRVALTDAEFDKLCTFSTDPFRVENGERMIERKLADDPVTYLQILNKLLHKNFDYGL